MWLQRNCHTDWNEFRSSTHMRYTVLFSFWLKVQVCLIFCNNNMWTWGFIKAKLHSFCDCFFKRKATCPYSDKLQHWLWANMSDLKWLHSETYLYCGTWVKLCQLKEDHRAAHPVSFILSSRVQAAWRPSAIVKGLCQKTGEHNMLLIIFFIKLTVSRSAPCP